MVLLSYMQRYLCIEGGSEGGMCRTEDIAVCAEIRWLTAVSTNKITDRLSFNQSCAFNVSLFTILAYSLFIKANRILK